MKAEKVARLQDRLKEALDVRGIKAIELSRKADVPRGAISYYLLGKTSPKADRLNIISVALNVSEAWLLGYDVPMERNAFVDKGDAEFIGSLPHLKPKEELPEEVAAINVLLYATGRQIMKCDGEYFLDECGKLTDEELNDIINTAVIAIKSTTDVLIGKRNKELVNYLKRKGSQ